MSVIDKGFFSDIFFWFLVALCVPPNVILFVVFGFMYTKMDPLKAWINIYYVWLELLESWILPLDFLRPKGVYKKHLLLFECQVSFSITKTQKMIIFQYLLLPILCFGDGKANLTLKWKCYMDFKQTDQNLL